MTSGSIGKRQSLIACGHEQEAGAAMSSALADGTLLAQQACFLPTSPDDLPVLGKIPGIEGAYIASGACTQLLKPRC